jgi:ribosomal protein S17
VKEGDRVKIAECRPLSKTVSFVVVEKLEEK